MSLACTDCDHPLPDHSIDCPRAHEKKPKRVPAMVPIPVATAESIGRRFGYDQVVVYGRRVGEDPLPHGEHLTTWGRNRDHCQVAKHLGNFLKHEIMGWPKQNVDEIEVRIYAAMSGYKIEGIGHPGSETPQFESRDGAINFCQALGLSYTVDAK